MHITEAGDARNTAPKTCMSLLGVDPLKLGVGF